MEKKNNNLVIGLLIGIVLMLAIVGCLFLGGVISFSKNNSNNNNDENNTIKSIKLDDAKDYVYDANYKYDNKYTEFDRGFERPNRTIEINNLDISVEIGGKEELNKLKVPYININSSNANKANAEIKELYLTYAKQFDLCAADMDTSKGGTGSGCSQILTYRKYQYNDILSIVIIDGVQSTAPFTFNFHVYNFDLNDGSMISYNDMLTKFNYTQDTALTKFKALIKSTMDTIYKTLDEDLSTACNHRLMENDPYAGNTDCYEISYKLLKKSIDDNSILFFVDDNGNLNLLSILYNESIQNGESTYYLIKDN